LLIIVFKLYDSRLTFVNEEKMEIPDTASFRPQDFLLGCNTYSSCMRVQRLRLQKCIWFQ